MEQLNLTILVLVASLAPPACLVIGLAAGAWLVYRTQKGQSPIPTIPSLRSLTKAYRESAEQNGEQEDKKPPRIGI